MNGNDSGAAVIKGDGTAAFPADRDGPTQDGCGGCDAEHDKDLRLDEAPLGRQPGETGAHFIGVRFLMDTAAAARRELEVFDGIRDVACVAGDAGSGEYLIEQASGRSDEGMAGEILLIAGLFADKHQARGSGALAEHRACRRFPKGAAAAIGGFGA
ncbi:hypothetical protein NCH01_22550 [Neoasaia chiangmaiensis]|nr:hypothetical protein NCH01_22550 [Neoasaia chiangmaiensis]